MYTVDSKFDIMKTAKLKFSDDVMTSEVGQVLIYLSVLQTYSYVSFKDVIQTAAELQCL